MPRKSEPVVHPLAAIFPMLPDDELAELAADIQANGLLHPIVRTVGGTTVVDGRNRLAACELAGVVPRFDDRIENDEQARALIVSANLHRRNLTKGQQAMALALIYPDPKRGRGNVDEARKGAETASFSYRRLKEARLVLRMGPDDLALAVIAGSKKLDEALNEARQRQNKASSEEAQIERLRVEAPDLADLVTEERMTLGEAIAAAGQRAEQKRVAIESARRVSENRLLDLCTSVLTLGAGYELGERGLITQEHLTRLEGAMNLLRTYYAEYEE